MSDGPAKCPRCGGELDYGRAVVRSVRADNDIALVTVVADVCTRCGEVLLHPKMHDKIVEAKRALKAGHAGEAVGHVYDMSPVRL